MRIKLSTILILLFNASIVFGQALEENLRQLDNNFLFLDGLYLDFQQFKNNQPSEAEISIVNGDFLIRYKGDTLKNITPWGISFNGKPCIFFDDDFDKLINLGKICHFSHKEIVEFNSVDAFGFPVVRREEQIVHYFFDIEKDSLKIHVLNSDNIDLFLDEHKMNKNLKKNYKTNKRLMYTLRLINNTFPIYMHYE